MGPATFDRPCALKSCGHRLRTGALILLALVSLCLSSWADEVVDCSQDGLLGALAIDGQALFTEDCSITITDPISITEGDWVIDAQGHNVSISGDNQFLVFEIQSNATLTISGVTISSGQNTNGGAFFIYNGSAVVFSNCTLVSNQAVGTNGVDGANGSDSSTGNGGNGRNSTAAGPAFGGAIFNLGSVTLLNCSVTNNSAVGGSGGSGGNGGNSSAQLGTGGNGGNGSAGGAAFGGAIYHAGDLLVVSNCTFAGNTVTGGNAGAGGGAGSGFADGRAGSGGAGGQGSGAGIYSLTNVVVVQSTFSDNTAQGGDSAAGGTASNGDGVSGPRGGDSFGGGFFATGGVVTNCTFYNNNTSGGHGGDGGPASGSLSNGGNGGNGGNATGGAIYNINSADGFALVSCTISNCSAFGGTNGAAGSGPFPGNPGNKGVSHGSVANGSGAFTLLNTILATNRSGGASFGSINDAGYNITFGNTLNLQSSTSFKTNDVKLKPLANNGGFTFTMALDAASPARDRIPPNPTNASFNPFPNIDQRGIPRALNTNADIGAYEYEFAGPPVIGRQPTNTSAMLHSNATFSVTAFGADTLTYQWRFNGVPIAKARGSSFTVTNATAATNGPYDVVVANGIDSVTSTQVFIQFSPSILSQPANQTVAPGGTATFVVSATGDGTPLYQWQFAGNDLTDQTNFSLTISDVHQSDIGSYQVIVTNDFGSITSAPAALNLLPGIITQPTNRTAASGSTVIFAVGAEGSSPLSYQWQKNGSNVANATASSFVIGNVQAGDAGGYNVVITNGFGSANSATGVLSVVQGITISAQPTSVIVPTNSDATFTVTASGAAPLAYQWRFNGTNLASQTATALALHNVQPANIGTYTVVITNPVSAVTSSPATLRLTAPLSIATPAIVSNRFNLPFNSQTGFTYVVEFKTNLNSTNWTLLLTTNGTGNPVIIQDSITNAQSRFYRVRAQ